MESGLKYVARNALAGRRLRSWAHLNAWLVEWATTVADVQVRGTTHEPPAERFRRETLKPLDGRPPYAWTHVRARVAARDALVSIDGSRYSVPAHLAGTIVTVREHATDFAIWKGDTVVATHARQGRRQVVMEPAHYARLLRHGSPHNAPVRSPLRGPRRGHGALTCAPSRDH